MFSAAYSLISDSQEIQLKKNLQENIHLELLLEYFSYAKESIEINEDTRCDKCNKKIKNQDFTFTIDQEILHTACYLKN